MNRKERRAALKRVGKAEAAGVDEMLAAAQRHYRAGELAPAQELCRKILNVEPKHRPALVLSGSLAQAAGRNSVAVRLLNQAIELGDRSVTCHDSLATAYQALGRQKEAVRHFGMALALGLGDVETLVMQSPPVAASLRVVLAVWPRRPTPEQLLNADGIAPIAREALLVALLQSKLVRDLHLEALFGAIRKALLLSAASTEAATEGHLDFACALARQCFINEYVYPTEDDEIALARELRDGVAASLASNGDISAAKLAAVAGYFPLSDIAGAELLLRRTWSAAIDEVLTQQVREPLEEARDRAAIPALTEIEGLVSEQVRQQYEENPYPRWGLVAPGDFTGSNRSVTINDNLRDRLGLAPAEGLADKAELQVLVAGCGTGMHSLDAARRYSRSRVLAVDISRASLAYARRKTRELGTIDIEYAQADILKLGGIGRRFDVVECVGVLHHMSDPLEGWRVLLSLLRPGGYMLVGLYSALARQSLTAALSIVAERGYRATADDIRSCRQELIQRGQALPLASFYSVTGCRDLLFNVMEHRFTLGEIRAFLEANRLQFLGIEVPPDVMHRFQQEYPDPAAPHDLDAWAAFEQNQPRMFINMYRIWLRSGDVEPPPNRDGS